MPSFRNQVTKYATVMISVISIWIYIGIVNEMLGIVDVPAPVLALLLFAALMAAHVLLIKSGVDKKQLDTLPDRLTLFKVFFGTLLGISLAIGLSLLTVGLVDDDYRHELSAGYTTCETSALKTMGYPVNKTVALPEGATLTVHRVAYEVPQRSDRPIEANAWRCAEAMMVEVTVDNLPDPDSDKSISVSDFKLRAIPPYFSGKTHDIAPESNAEDYDTSRLGPGEISILQLRFLPEGVTSDRGWLVYAVSQDEGSKAPQLLYANSGDVFASVPLPSHIGGTDPIQ